MARSLHEKLVKQIPDETKRLIRKQADFADRLQKLIKDTGKTQKQFAKEAGLLPSFLSRILAGETNVTLKTIAKLESALGIELLMIPAAVEEIDQSVFLAHRDDLHDDLSDFYKILHYAYSLWESASTLTATKITPSKPTKVHLQSHGTILSDLDEESELVLEQENLAADEDIDHQEQLTQTMAYA